MKTPVQPGPFLNRELNWLAFNQRVLDEALNPENPLLERFKFFCISSSNLDEFFEVRVAGLKQQIEAGSTDRSLDGLTAAETFNAIQQRVRKMTAAQGTCWREHLEPQLAARGIRFHAMQQLSTTDREWLHEYFRAEVLPVLTPLAIDPAHPFPQIQNRTLNLIAQMELTVRSRAQPRLALVQVPRVLPPVVRLPGKNRQRHDYVFLSHVIGTFLNKLFPDLKILGHWPFRVTRNSELYIDDEEVANLLSAVENELQNRRRGEAVRLEVSHKTPPEIRTVLLKHLRLAEDDLYAVHAPMNPGPLMNLVGGNDFPELHYPSFVAPIPTAVKPEADIFEEIRKRDLLLHHPYENYEGVVNFLQEAAADPRVLAIKQTLYRTGGDPRIIGALMEAVRNGKQVTAVVELRARFDEANNIQWARQLEDAGVHVVYGLVGYKIHAKATLVVRRDEDQIRRYMHLATGNYNPGTARVYTDLSLLTAHSGIAEDVANLFNLITGICQFRPMKHLLVAPFSLHDGIIGLIRREAENARRNLPGRIIAKVNSLVDPQVIQELYAASEAGVKIDLIVRGICCLRPGVPGLSSNITVRSIVDRFLEHSRIFYFDNVCRPEVFLSSADWMPRNFFRRIELAVPILDGRLRERVISELLALPLADTLRARRLSAQGTYSPPPLKDGETPHRSQFEFIDRAVKQWTPLKLAARNGDSRSSRLVVRKRSIAKA